MYTRWKILLLVFFARIALGFQFQVMGSVSPQLVEQLSMSHAAAGTLIGLFLFSGIFLSFPAGFANRFVSDRALVTGGLLLLALGGWISSLNPLFSTIAFGRIVCGAGFVLSTLYFAKMVADWFSGREMATAMSVLVMSWPIGIALGQVVHPVIAERFGYTAALYTASIYCFVAALFVTLGYRAPQTENAGSLKTATPLTSTNFTTSHWKLTVIAASVWGFFNAGYVVYLSFAARAIQADGYTEIQASMIASIASWIMIFSAIAAGQLADRTGKRDLILYFSMFAAVLSLTMLAFQTAIIFATILFGLLGAASAGIIMALTGESMPAESRAFGMGIFFTIYFIIGLPAPAIAGWLYDITDNLISPMLFGAFLFALVAVLNALFRKISQVTLQS